MNCKEESIIQTCTTFNTERTFNTFQEAEEVSKKQANMYITHMIHDTHNTSKDNIIGLLNIFFRSIDNLFTYVVDGSKSVSELHDCSGWREEIAMVVFCCQRSLNVFLCDVLCVVLLAR